MSRKDVDSKEADYYRHKGQQDGESGVSAPPPSANVLCSEKTADQRNANTESYRAGHEAGKK